jgi:predicted AAA+ superfamily ATPase
LKNWLDNFPDAYRRWSSAYHSQLVREDIRDMAGIASVGDVETLFALLPGRVGSPLSATSLAQDLKVSYNTVRRWLAIFERFQLTFSVGPWTRGLARATQKARKTYLFDYALIDDAAARFENMVAVELYRAVNLWTDLGYGSFGLHFVRNRNGQEVDFLIVENRRPLLLVEAKASSTQVEPSLTAFQEQLGVPAVQLTGGGNTFQRFSCGGQPVLVAPVTMWVPRLS